MLISFQLEGRMEEKAFKEGGCVDVEHQTVAVNEWRAKIDPSLQLVCVCCNSVESGVSQVFGVLKLKVVGDWHPQFSMTWWLAFGIPKVVTPQLEAMSTWGTSSWQGFLQI